MRRRDAFLPVLRAGKAQKEARILVRLKPLFAFRTLTLVVFRAQRAVVVSHEAFVFENRERRTQELVANRARERKKRAALFAARLLVFRRDFVSAFTAMHEGHRAIFLPRRHRQIKSRNNVAKRDAV